MTVAVDIKTGAVVGQVVGELAPSHVQGRGWGWLRLLTKDGYKDVPAASVRLEKV